MAHVCNHTEQLTKTIIVVGMAENMLEDAGGAPADGLPRALKMRAAWIRHPPIWLDVDQIRDATSEGWPGLFAGLTEDGFDEIGQHWFKC